MLDFGDSSSQQSQKAWQGGDPLISAVIITMSYLRQSGLHVLFWLIAKFED